MAALELRRETYVARVSAASCCEARDLIDAYAPSGVFRRAPQPETGNGVLCLYHAHFQERPFVRVIRPSQLNSQLEGRVGRDRDRALQQRQAGTAPVPVGGRNLLVGILEEPVPQQAGVPTPVPVPRGCSRWG